jgi:Zn finger protein HypA/HybF involved in hydrogenase expression
MNCQKCKSSNVLSEGVGEGKVRVTCQECGSSEVKDQQGRHMLTDDAGGANDRRDLLTS